MSTFDRFRDTFFGNPNAPDRPGVPGLDAYAASQGWQPRVDEPGRGEAFDGMVRGRVHDAVKARAGINSTSKMGAGQTRFHDAYGGTFQGRQFVIGNAWTPVGYMSVVSVCALQLVDRSMLPMLVVEPRHHGLMSMLFGGYGRATPVSPAFDERYAVYAHPEEAAQGLLTPQVQTLMLQRSDWRFWTVTTALVCMADIVYASPGDVAGWLAQMTAIAEAMPVAVLPTIDEMVPGLPPGLSFGQTLFTGGKFDKEGMQRQFEAMSPEEQAQTLEAVRLARERHQADAAARREERKRRR